MSHKGTRWAICIPVGFRECGRKGGALASSLELETVSLQSGLGVPLGARVLNASDIPQRGHVCPTELTPVPTGILSLQSV